MDTERSRSRDKQPQEPANEVYVCFLPAEVTQDELKTIFSECGDVANVNLKKKEDGFTFAYVRYSSVDEAKNAVEKLNRRKMGEKSISVKFANKRPNNRQNTEKKQRKEEGQKDAHSERRPRKENNQDAKESGNQERKPMKCFKCQQMGHMSRNCTKQVQEKKQQPSKKVEEKTKPKVQSVSKKGQEEDY